MTKLFTDNGLCAIHEHYHLPWDEPDYVMAFDALMGLENRANGRQMANVAFYWLPYVDWLLKTYRDGVRFVCFKRQREKVVASFMRSIKALSPYFRMWNVIDLRMSGGGNNLKLSNNFDRSVMEEVDDSTREWMEAEWDVDCYIDQFANSFPDYPCISDKEVYLNHYWTEYYKKVEEYTDLPNFLLIDMERGLNTEEGRAEILNFIGCS